ncbi:type III-B CRISPR module RAMP protein Cmr4 [Paenibacillus sp. IB182496]|uniref:Type III-B CRISPR module RAMP protein Cmr4 n=1 Tax=Paenibacillus sabuli TaxID=2772509 RepID=A0A927BN58_9BACL|nr:type III-B CRISPR module RAMP protein Cmr4 [Paenibacillus sabuli]MBD2843613.1 type III-B CRISPR module RAMP protein Cmr4 [Paenibacillus sabuli]
MFTQYQPLLLYAATSVHAGSGSETGIVDLPIQREQHTAFPKMESSTLKGAWKQCFSETLVDGSDSETDFFTVFGSSPSDNPNNESQASAVSFLDARILLFPVKSLKGTFAWITCPYVLRRFNRDMELLSAVNGGENPYVLKTAAAGSVSGSTLKVSEVNKNDQTFPIVLEEYTLTVKQTSEAAELAQKLDAWLQLFGEPLGIEEKLVVVSDDEFTDFVKMSTEVNARIRIEDNGQVAGGLWYEENIPPETVFYSSVLFGNPREPQKKRVQSGLREGLAAQRLKTAEDVRDYVLNERFPDVFQLGGSATIGKGMIRAIQLPGGVAGE